MEGLLDSNLNFGFVTSPLCDLRVGKSIAIQQVGPAVILLIVLRFPSFSLLLSYHFKD